MIDRITSTTNPSLLLLKYSDNLEVVDLTIVPKIFFVPQVIEKRKPLSITAKRAGWIGCNILLSEIPEQGKIHIISNQKACDVISVVEQYKSISKIQTNNIMNRSWIMDILKCINRIEKNIFCCRMYMSLKMN